MGPGNVGGFNKVESLATYLVGLTSISVISLTNDQASRIIGLWEQLDPYNKGTTTFSPRHRTKATGRFKSPKKRANTVVPGVESTKR